MTILTEQKIKIYFYHPPEYRKELYVHLNEGTKKGLFTYKTKIEETAPPPELIKDIIEFTGSIIAIIEFAYLIYTETKKKKGKVVIRATTQDFDLEVNNIDELKIHLSKPNETEKNT